MFFTCYVASVASLGDQKSFLLGMKFKFPSCGLWSLLKKKPSEMEVEQVAQPTLDMGLGLGSGFTEFDQKEQMKSLISIDDSPVIDLTLRPESMRRSTLRASSPTHSRRSATPSYLREDYNVDSGSVHTIYSQATPQPPLQRQPSRVSVRRKKSVVDKPLVQLDDLTKTDLSRSLSHKSQKELSRKASTKSDLRRSGSRKPKETLLHFENIDTTLSKEEQREKERLEMLEKNPARALREKELNRRRSSRKKPTKEDSDDDVPIAQMALLALQQQMKT
ncbi:hypothetical protein EDD86DRAFT_103371 [Gorgonomyces haynaldii]|nr:hypothetical protein EDD86DRAFT_103371 [Gorgonomyces haynaldii]